MALPRCLPAGLRGSFLVAGTGPGVGKTLVAAAFVRALRSAAVNAVAMKAVARGVVRPGGAWACDELQRLAAAGAFPLPLRALCPRLLAPCPGRVATGILPDRRLELDAAVDTFRVLSTWADAVVVEGVDDPRDRAALAFDDADLAAELELPMVLVVGLRPGCVETARARVAGFAMRGIECAGWIANHDDPGFADSRRAIENLARSLPAPCLGSIPRGPAKASPDKSTDTDRMIAALAG